MSVNRYSLADYSVTFSFPSNIQVGDGFVTLKSFSIGGPGNASQPGSFVGEIKVTRAKEMFTTEGDVTGSYVHSRNLDKTGTIEIQLRQVSSQILDLLKACKTYETATGIKGVQGMTITINAPMGEYDVQRSSLIISKCTDCFPTKVPDQVFSDTAQMQTWTFTCGNVDFPMYSDSKL